MDQSKVELLIFTIGHERFAIPAADVAEVVRAVTIARLPKAPAIIEGIINLRGVVVPVIDIRQRFRLPLKPNDPSDQMIVARAGARTVALRADQIVDLLGVPIADIDGVAETSSIGEYVAGVAKLPDGLVLIHDLATFLSSAESDALASLGA